MEIQIICVDLNFHCVNERTCLSTVFFNFGSTLALLHAKKQCYNSTKSNQILLFNLPVVPTVLVVRLFGHFDGFVVPMMLAVVALRFERFGDSVIKN